MNRLLASVLFAAALVACNKGEGDKSTPSASATAAAPLALSAGPAMSAIAKAVAPAAPPSEPADSPPTEQKADNKAAREISPTNYKTELTKLEKEIGSP